MPWITTELILAKSKKKYFFQFLGLIFGALKAIFRLFLCLLRPWEYEKSIFSKNKPSIKKQLDRNLDYGPSKLPLIGLGIARSPC